MTTNNNSESFKIYLSSDRALWYWLLIAISLTTAIIVYVIPNDVYPWAFLRNVLGVIFVFFLPGYAFTKVVFPTKLSNEVMESLGVILRIAFSVGISIAIVSIIGFILYYTPFGLDLTPIIISLLTFTIILATAGAIRESRTKN